jgi:outer membrane immunogenic protein
MKLTSAILGLATAAALSSTAFAADLPARVVKPGIAPAASCFWAGPYVGAKVGYTWNNVTTNLVDANGRRANSDHNKVTGGIYGGYNFCLTPGLVAGVELDFMKYGNSAKSYTSNPGRTLFVYNNHDTNYGGSAVVRLGAPVNNALFFVKAGVGAVKTKAYDSVTDLAGSDTFRVSKTSFGYVLGAGVDYAFTRNWVGRLDYTYFDAGKASSQGAYWKRNYHTVNLGIAYKF